MTAFDNTPTGDEGGWSSCVSARAHPDDVLTILKGAHSEWFWIELEHPKFGSDFVLACFPQADTFEAVNEAASDRGFQNAIWAVRKDV